MGKRDVWFFAVLVIFFGNTYHIVKNHNELMAFNGDDGMNVVGSMLSSFSKGSGSTSISHKMRKGDDDDVDDLPVFAICLLTRDDLPILPEWIAYHYHAINLRHLVVAVDPVSKTDPKPVFENFRKHLGTKNSTNVSDNDKQKDGLIIEQWSEADFMPKYFVDGDHGRAPNFVGGHGNPDTETWEEWYSKKKNFGFRKRRDQTLINSHRYRQTRFLARCSEHLRDTYNNNKTVWMSTLDSDEYLAVNPWVMSERPVVEPSVRRLEAGSVLRWFIDSKEHLKQEQEQQEQKKMEGSDVCFQIPRLLFGAVELSPNTTDPSKLASDTADAFVQKARRTESESATYDFVKNLPRRSNKMETLRWKFHAAPNDERNFQQKVILDLHRIPRDDEIWGDHVHTVHRPSRKLCIPETDNNLNGTLLVPPGSDGSRRASPVVAYHYIGSEERYFSRPDDFRRNPKKYRERSNITHARDETGWIDQWLEKFVENVGVETASALLSTYAVNLQEEST